MSGVASIELRFVNKQDDTVVVFDDAALAWGEFYDGSDREIPSYDIIGKEITYSSAVSVWARKRVNSLSGTEGTLDLTEQGGARVGSVHWNVPLVGLNSWSAEDTGEEWVISFSGGSRSGPAGTVTVELAKVGFQIISMYPT